MKQTKWNAFLLTLVVLALAMSTVLPASASPQDRGRIVFVANPSGSWQLYTINPDGTDMTQVTDFAPTEFEAWFPSISPDGNKIAFDFVAKDENGNDALDIYVINVDGTGLSQITHDGISGVPRWSPDGSQFVFVQLPPTSPSVIVRMNVDGTGSEVLTDGLWDTFAASFTPDGKKIVFNSTMGGFVGAVWTMNIDGTEKKRITAAPYRAAPGGVSPDGKQVVCIDDINNPLLRPNAIFAVDLDGSDLHYLTRPKGASHDLPGNFSPDGSKVVFVSDRGEPDGGLDLYTMNANGTGRKQIATGLTVGGCPSGNCVLPFWGTIPSK